MCGFISDKYRAFYGGPFLWMSIAITSVVPFVLLAVSIVVIIYFYIYILTGSRYRKELSMMCGCGQPEKTIISVATTVTS